MNRLLDPSVPLGEKFLFILDFVIWALFGTSFSNDVEMFVPGKIISVIVMILGVAYNVYVTVQILNVLKTIHAPRTKYYEVMNQLDAYMKTKNFPKHLQDRLRFFYKKKFRGYFYREEEILEMLSGECTA